MNTGVQSALVRVCRSAENFPELLTPWELGIKLKWQTLWQALLPTKPSCQVTIQ